MNFPLASFVWCCACAHNSSRGCRVRGVIEGEDRGRWGSRSKIAYFLSVLAIERKSQRSSPRRPWRRRNRSSFYGVCEGKRWRASVSRTKWSRVVRRRAYEARRSPPLWYSRTPRRPNTPNLGIYYFLLFKRRVTSTATYFFCACSCIFSHAFAHTLSCLFSIGTLNRGRGFSLSLSPIRTISWHPYLFFSLVNTTT